MPSRINDEFLLLQEIIAKCPALGVPFQLYDMSITVQPGWVSIHHDTFDDLFPGLRSFARWVLQRYW